MNKIGVLYCCFNALETLHQSLKPWVDARAQKLDNREYVISAVSVPFAEYREMNLKVDDTPQVLSREYYGTKKIDYLTVAPEFVDEKTARTLALMPLLDEGCDMVILVDGDEEYALENITKIFRFAELDKFTSWFKVSLKNYVFDSSTYLADSFQPPRIFRVNTNGYKLESFAFDNDPIYVGTVVQHSSFKERRISYKELPCKTIPPTVAAIPHYSWISSEKTKNKCRYQENHFAFGAGCSFKWDDKNNCLAWNEEYFKKTGQPIPQIVKETA